MARDSAVRITTAASSRHDDIMRRQRRYLLSMGLRTVCFVGAVLVGPGWVRWVLVVGALLLPYVAVVMANAVSTKSDDFALRDAQNGAPQLEQRAEPEAPLGSDSI